MKSQEKLNHFYSKSPLLIKLNVLIFLVTLLLCVSFTVFIILFYQFNVTKRRVTSNIASAERAVSSLNMNMSDILQNFSRICSSKDFLNELYSIQSNPEDISLHRQNLDSITNELETSHYLVSSVLILSGSAPYYSYAPYSSPTYQPVSFFFSDEELNKIQQITWLPQRKEPSNLTNQVIPLVIPVTNAYNLITIASPSSDPPAAFVVLFIDVERLQASLMNTGITDQKLNYYLVDSDGFSIMGNPLYESALTQERFSELSTELNAMQNTAISYENGLNNYLLYQLNSPGLLLLCHAEQETLLDFWLNTGASLLIAVLMILALMFVISSFMNRYVTRPLLKLNSIVYQIESETYTQPVHFRTHDELGRLLESINQMYLTIQHQKNQIKEEESAKYQTELKLLTEQINPHFLYNTLEEIQSEVIRYNNDTATSMIHYLADYLRISLSGGADIITINNELRHVNAYINIMNQRFNQSILLIQRIDPSLHNGKILKTILQPLVENSIRHGFGIDSAGMQVSVPTIEISFSLLAPDTMQICVNDNGSGFDAARVLQLMKDHSQDPHKHVGVNNVYHRLITFYGEDHVLIETSSIPYYQNSISITLQHIGPQYLC